MFRARNIARSAFHGEQFSVSEIKLCQCVYAHVFPQINDEKGYPAIVGRRFARAFHEYKPNLIVSVHPLMQHVPVR